MDRQDQIKLCPIYKSKDHDNLECNVKLRVNNENGYEWDESSLGLTSEFIGGRSQKSNQSV